MATLTLTQLAAVEQNTTYQTKLRAAVLNKAAFEKAAGIAATEAWFRSRQTAENILANPQVSVDPKYWAARSMAQLKLEDVTGITGASTAEEIALAITDVRYDAISVAAYTLEVKKVLF